MLVFMGTRGAPGATTAMLAVASCWPGGGRRYLIEADPDGGVLAARWGLGHEPGLMTLAAAARGARTGELAPHAQELADDFALIAGPPTPDQAEAALSIAGPRLAALRPAAGETVFVDAGRGPRPVVSPVVQAAAVVMLVARPRLDQLQQLVPRYRALRGAGQRVGVVLVGDGPYGSDEVVEVLDSETREAIWAVLPEDAHSAAVLNAQRPARLAAMRRAPLLRAARALAERIATLSTCDERREDGGQPPKPAAHAGSTEVAS